MSCVVVCHVSCVQFATCFIVILFLLQNDRLQHINFEVTDKFHSAELQITATHTEYRELILQKDVSRVIIMAPNDTAYTRWICHSSHKLL